MITTKEKLDLLNGTLGDLHHAKDQIDRFLKTIKDDPGEEISFYVQSLTECLNVIEYRIESLKNYTIIQHNKTYGQQWK